jgi:hemerythrin
VTMRNQEENVWRDILPLEWNQRQYTTGFAHIDEQHRELFDGLNGLTLFLKNASVTDDPESQNKVIKLLYFLGEYVIKHFHDEEEVFAQCNHPLAAVNKAAHQAFVEKYFEYNDQLINGIFSLDLLIQLHSFLHTWLINHIVKIDTTLRECGGKMAVDDGRSTGNRIFFDFFSTMLNGKRI